MTQVVFIFHNPDGTPRADTPFVVTLRRPGLNDEDNAVVLPDTYHMVTDDQGQFLLELEAVTSPYKVRLEPEDETICCGQSFQFYVPESDVPVYVQDLILLPPPTDVPWDEEQMNKIAQAVVDSKNSADAAHASEVAAEASADRAEAAAQGVEDYAAAAAQSAADAALSQSAAANSAAAASQSEANAGTSAAAAGQSAADALASKNAAADSATAAGNSATAAAGSATAADASKTAAAGSATAAAGSATTASTKAGEAAASATAAQGSATTASNAAGTATTEADRSKTEADRAQGYADSINPGSLAPINSPTFTGDPKAPTPAKADNDTSIATTAHVKLVVADYAPLASPALTGIPTGPTPVAGNSSTQLATTAFVATSFAPLASPTFTGDPKAPTPAASDRDTSIATTAFVGNAMAQFGIGTPVGPNWPNTSLDVCTGAVQGLYRGISGMTEMPTGFGTSCSILFTIQNNTDGAVRFGQIVTDLTANRVAWRTCNSGSFAAPNWNTWKEVAPLASPTFTGTVTASGALNTGNLSASSVYSSSTIRADGDISSKTGFTATPATDGTTALTLFTKADFANSSYLQLASTPTGTNIVSGVTGTGVGQNLDFYTTAGAVLRIGQNATISFPTAGLLQGIWSGSPISSRTRLQTSVVNGNTAIVAIPNGTAQVSGIHFYGSSSDQENCSFLSLYMNQAAEAVIASSQSGAGVNLPLSLFSGSTRVISIKNANGTDKSIDLADGWRFTGDFNSGPGVFANRFFIQSRAGSTQTQLSLRPPLGATGTLNVGVQFWNSNTLEDSNRLDLYVDSSGYCSLAAGRTGSSVSYKDLMFWTSALERARFTATGEFLVGTSSTAGFFGGSANNFGIYLSGAGGIVASTASAGNANYWANKRELSNPNAFAFGYQGAVVGTIGMTANSVAYNTTSDERLKWDIRTMVSPKAYIMALRPVLHRWKGEDEADRLPTAGFIAHELAEVFPQAVTGEKDAVDELGNIIPQVVDLSKMVPMLVASLQALIEENDAQSEENRVLKLQMSAVLEHLNLTVDTTSPKEPVTE